MGVVVVGMEGAVVVVVDLRRVVMEGLAWGWEVMVVSGGSGGIVGGWLAGVRPVRLGEGIEEEG